jgi:hypothetical protein
VQLDEEMGVLEARFRLLSSERRRVIQGLESITYPVLTLPAEITTHIFSHYVDSPHLGFTRTPGRGPLVLASVCRHWREICLSTAALWTSLRLYPEYDERRDVEGLVSLLRLWLSRAGRHAMDLHVYRCSHAVPIYSELAQCSVQWSTFGLTLDVPYAFPNEEIRGRVPALTKLVVTIFFESHNEPVLLTAFSDAPLLRHAQLSGASLQWISLPWIQLTHLEFSDESLSACIEVLKQTPNLEVLVVYTLNAGDADLSSITLPNLHIPSRSVTIATASSSTTSPCPRLKASNSRPSTGRTVPGSVSSGCAPNGRSVLYAYGAVI